MSKLEYRILPVTPFQQNCTLVWDSDTGKGAFVDPGGDIDRLLELAEQQGVDIEKILVTHGHLDHVGGVGDMAEKLGVQIEGPHKDDAFWIDALPEQGQRFGFPASKSFTPDRWLVHGDTVTVGGLEFDVLHCPGHTPGHVVFHHKESGWAQVGDVLFQGSIGRSDFPRGNHEDLVNSIRGRLFPLGDEVKFVPGHGSMSTFGQERLTNPFVADSQYG